MYWLKQDEIIEKIEYKIADLRNATYIAEKGMEAVKKNTMEGIEKYAEFKIRQQDYNTFADFLEEILLNIDLIKKEEVKQLEQAEINLRDLIKESNR